MLYQVICDKCHNKCVIDIDKIKEEYVFEGHKCDDGIDYSKNYIKDNKKIFTSVVRIKGEGTVGVAPVKSSKPIDLSLWLECSKALSRIYVGIPLKIGDTICKNILNTGVDIIATKNINRC